MMLVLNNLNPHARYVVNRSAWTLGVHLCYMCTNQTAANYNMLLKPPKQLLEQDSYLRIEKHWKCTILKIKQYHDHHHISSFRSVCTKAEMLG